MQKKKTAGMGSIKTGRKNLFLFFSILAVVAVSGCVVPGGDVFAGMFGPQRPATSEASADLITTQNVNIIPNPPISAENGFTVSFEVKNNDENEEVKNVLVKYYDTGLCKEGKTSFLGGGGTSEDTENVHYTEGSNVTTISVSCSGGGTGGTLYLEEGAVSRQTFCGKTNDYQVKNLDAYTFYLYIGNHYEYFKYREVKTNEGEVYNCVKGTGGNECKKTYDGISYTITDVKNYPRAQCTGSTTCADDCSAVCDRQNSDCKKACDKYSGDSKTACLSQCDKYAVTVGVAESAPCWAEFRPASGFSGECCRCDYVTTGFPEGAPITAVAGAKTYYPLQTELKEWGFTAPKNSEIGNMPRTCGIKYKITYDFTAKTQTDVSVISKGKMEEMQRAGQEPSANPTQSVGVGPIKVFFDFGASQPIKSGDVLPVFITVEDRGTGIYSKVLAGKLKIKLPSNFEKIACDKFTGSGGELKNTADIPMIKKKSPQLRCSFKMPSVTDMKTFYIAAELPYEYKLDDEIKVSVNPTLVR